MLSLTLLLALVMVNGPLHAEVTEPDTYRMERFREPVPESLKGATVLTALQAYELWKARSAIFIDVLPRAPKPENLPENTVWRDKKRLDIPGSIWLPNVGYGKLNPEMDTWFRSQLDKLTDGKKDKAVLVYCLADCWMSWNAAKRAIEYGYSNVLWFPEGTDGWTFEDFPVEKRLPEPGPQS